MTYLAEGQTMARRYRHITIGRRTLYWGISNLDGPTLINDPSFAQISIGRFYIGYCRP